MPVFVNWSSRVKTVLLTLALLAASIYGIDCLARWLSMGPTR